MAATSGRFKDGKYKGWRWQVYEDPASPTGYTKKVWNPTDTSNGGRPVEFFSPHDIEADREDDAEAEAKVKEAQGRAARIEATRQETRTAKTKEAEALQAYNEKKASREEDQKRWDRQSKMDIAKLDRKTQLELAKQKVDEDRRQFDLSFGADLLKTGAQMRGPLNAFQGFSYARGVEDSGFSPFVAALMPGGNTSYGGGTAKTGAPTPLTVGTLVKEMTGQGQGAVRPGAATDQYGRPVLSGEQQAQLAPIQAMFQGGLANAKQGQIENLTDNELKALQSGGDYLGYDTGSELEFWKRSRAGQGNGLAA